MVQYSYLVFFLKFVFAVEEKISSKVTPFTGSRQVEISFQDKSRLGCSQCTPRAHCTTICGPMRPHLCQCPTIGSYMDKVKSVHGFCHPVTSVTSTSLDRYTTREHKIILHAVNRPVIAIWCP